jgi:aminopeptidase N
MKKIYFIIILFSSVCGFSQRIENCQDELVAAERNSASKLVNMAINPHTQNYDVTYHRLDFTINPTVYSIAGKVTTTFTALSAMNTVTFDFSKITTTTDTNYANRIIVSSVKQNGSPVSFVHNNANELVITLSATLPTGNSTSVEITYSGAPANSGFGSFVKTTHASTPVIWTLSEPFGAMDWWPCKQDLNDKVDNIDVYITAPSQYISVSNGIEPEAPVVVGANKTTHFHHGYPIPAYLIAIACTNYSVYNQTVGVGTNAFPIINYIYPENLTAVQTQLAQTPLILDLYKNLYEIYPFKNEKYGHAQFNWGGGMEHTTVSFMVNFNRQLIAHEMAHQWFGDKITCGSWKDIWLNESFATYVAAQVIENFDGIPAFIIEKDNMISNITSVSNGAVYLTDAQATNVNRIFSSRLSYNKGAMVLEMLRFKMGDTAFFQAIKNYLADTNLAYKYAVTTDLKTHLETVYGSSLTEFFNDWIYNQGFPTYDVVGQILSGNQIQFTVNQTQSDPSVSYFEMPVPIRVFGVSGQQMDLVLNNTVNGEIFTRTVPFAITSFDFDPDRHLISASNNTTLANENFDWNDKIKIYPNPVTNVLNIEIPNNLELETVTITNILGQTVIEKNLGTIDVSQLSAGVYNVKIKTTAGIFHKKIIKN